MLEPPTVDIDYLAVNSAGVMAGTGRSGVQVGSENSVNEHGDVLGSDNILDRNRETGEYYPQQLPLVWPAGRSAGERKQLKLTYASAVNTHGWVAGQTHRGGIDTPAVEFVRGKR